MADLTGQQLSNYRLTRRLGSGGFADVYLGENIFIGNLVAIKLLHTLLEGENARNFLFEAQTLVRLSHQHIIRVLDFRIERGRPMLIMDYVQGGSLRQKHGRGAYLPLEQVVHYIKQVAEALQFAHNQQIIHQDVKPDNVLVGAEQHLYLSDFGLALFAPSPADLDTQPGAGTRLYMAPEQWKGHPTVFSDQYSLAIMAYEWLCGKRPFEGNQIELFSQHMFEKPQPLRELCPELPEGVERVILQALAKEPGQRFASVRAFALALERASQEEITEVGSVKKVQPEGKTTRDELDEDKTPIQRKLFIAAASADNVFAEKVSADLHKRNIKLTHEPRAAMQQEEVLREAIRASSLVMIVASPQMRTSRTIREQLRIALLYKRQLVLVWARGENIAASLLDLSGQTAGQIEVIDARNGRYETALDEIVDCLQEDTSATPVAVSPQITLNDEPRNPYKGLRAFSGEDASDFFGRDELVQRILGMLEKMLSPRRPVKYQQRLLTVVGPSGSGKSSVVMAGVLPKLQRGAIAGSEQWCYLETIVPGQHPCERLLSILEKQFPQKTPAEVRKILAAENGYGLYQLASMLSGLTNRRVVLCVDQFEELFAVGVPEAERQHFLKLLITAITEPESPLVVLLTLRADFYDRPMHHRELATLMTANQVSVLPMSNDELRAAIERPAAQADVQLFFEGDLVGDLLFELHGQEGALPLLEFTLEQLFQQRQGHVLTHGAYRAIGGLRGALARHADDVYDGLPSNEHRNLVQALFLRLIDPGKSEQDTTRRRMVVSELLFEDEEQTRLMNEVAHSFISARLLTTTVVAGATSIEVSHEALIREWPRLVVWLRSAREDILLQNKITVDAATWLKAGRADDRLYRGVQLGEAVGWLGRNKGNADEAAFVRAGQAEEGKRKLLEEARLKEKLRLEKRAVQRLRGFVVALSLFLVVSIVAALGLYSINQQVIKEKQTAQSNELAVNSSFALSQQQTDLALLLGVKATQFPSDTLTYEARNSLFQAINQNGQLVMQLGHQISSPTTLSFTKSGKTLLGTDGSHIYKWDTNTGKSTQILLKNNPENLGGTAFSPDNNFMLNSFKNGVFLWNLQTGTAPILLEGPITGIPNAFLPPTAITYSSNGAFAAGGRCSEYSKTANPNDAPTCITTEISVWNMRANQPELISTLHTILGDITNLSVSAISAQVAFVSNTGIQFWNAGSDGILSPILPGSSNTTSLAFSPDGSTLSSGTNDGTIKLWNVQTQKQLPFSPLTGQTGSISCVAFSPDGNKLASSSEDTTTNIWNPHTGEKLWALKGDGKEKTSVTFGPDSAQLATGSGDGQIMLWDINAESSLSQHIGNLKGWSSLLLDYTGKIAFTGNEQNMAFQQTIAGGKLLHSFDMSKFPLINTAGGTDASFTVIESLALSKNGTTLAMGRSDGMITLWDTQTGAFLKSFRYSGRLHQVLLSADTKLLISSGDKGKVVIQDTTKNSNSYTFQSAHSDRYTPIAFDANRKLLAVADCNKRETVTLCTEAEVRILEINTHQTIRELPIPNEAFISGLAFSPNGQFIAASVQDGITIWSTSSWKQQGPTLRTQSTVYSPAFSNDTYRNLQFSANNKFLVSYTIQNQSTFVVWDITSMSPLADVIREDGVIQGGSLTFDPDSQKVIIVLNRDGKNTLLSWSIQLQQWQHQACEIANRNLTQGEWDRYVHNGIRNKICPDLPLDS